MQGIRNEIKDTYREEIDRIKQEGEDE